MITTVSELKGEELIKNIHNGILRKLQSAKQLVNFDKEISAGLYTYALEEFGKLLLVKESKVNNLYEIDSKWFKTHKDKFRKVFDFLRENNHGQCIVITEGDYVANDFDRRDYIVDLLADFEARLSIFNVDIDIVKIPNVDRDMLSNAINEFEKAINEA